MLVSSLLLWWAFIIQLDFPFFLARALSFQCYITQSLRWCDERRARGCLPQQHGQCSPVQSHKKTGDLAISKSQQFLGLLVELGSCWWQVCEHRAGFGIWIRETRRRPSPQLMIYKKMLLTDAVVAKCCVVEPRHKSSVRIWSPSPPTQRTHPDFVQTSPEETWHRFSAANLCRGKSLVLPLQLTSDNLYYFIFPQNTPVLHYLCLLTRSLALTWLQHCSAGKDASVHKFFFLPSYLQGV